MWARISEIVLGAWLLFSHFIFEDSHYLDIPCALLVCFFAGISYVEKLNKMHLLQIIPITLLLYAGFSYPTPLLPIFMQNYILIALTLSIFCIIPSNASDHPKPWKKFLQKNSMK